MLTIVVLIWMTIFVPSFPPVGPFCSPPPAAFFMFADHRLLLSLSLLLSHPHPHSHTRTLTHPHTLSHILSPPPPSFKPPSAPPCVSAAPFARVATCSAATARCRSTRRKATFSSLTRQAPTAAACLQPTISASRARRLLLSTAVSLCGRPSRAHTMYT